MDTPSYLELCSETRVDTQAMTKRLCDWAGNVMRQSQEHRQVTHVLVLKQSEIK